MTKTSFITRLLAVMLLAASPLWAVADVPQVMTSLSLKGTDSAVAPPADTGGPRVASNYVFSTTTTGSLVDMSTGTTTLLAANLDDNASPVTLIGFDFFFQGARQDRFSVNSNGTLRFGATAVGNTLYNPLAQATQSLITAFGADQRTHTSGRVHSKVIGTAPNRTLVVEWLNMQANFNAGGTADLTYQVQLSETTGTIAFAYGVMSMSTAGAADANSQSPQFGFSSNNTAGNVGSVTAAQSGTPAPTFDGTLAAPANNLYVAGPIVALSSATDGTRRTFSFVSPAAVAPGGPISFTAISASSLTLNWTDSSNELGYAIYNSTDGVNFSFVNTAAANATSLAVTGLAPSTSYTWRVVAFTEGATAFISGVQATTAPVANASLGTGLWSAPGTWSSGSVPTAGDAVTIAATHTVTIDVAATAFSVSVANGGVLQFEQTTARTLTTNSDVSILAGGTLQSNPAGTVTAHSLVVGGNLNNAGTLDFSTNADTAGAGITFINVPNTSFSGAGATTDVRLVTINKGTSSASTLQLNPTNFTVRGVTTDTVVGGWLVLTNGTIRISGTFAGTSRVFSAAAYTIPATAGFWLDNPNYVVAAQVGNAVNNGLFRVTQGQFNQGTLASHSMRGGTGAVFTFEGGTLNFAAQFSPQNAVTYNQSGGTVNVGLVGNSQSNFGTFELFSGTASFNMTGGSIIIHQASTGATPIDFQNLGTVVAATGTVQVGSTSTATNFNFRLRGRLPNLVIDNTTNAKTATATAQLTIFGSTTINTGTTFVIDGQVCLILGPTFTNNGTLTGTTVGTRFYFLGGQGPTTYTGTGTVTAPLTAFEVDNIAGVTIAPATVNSIVASRFNNFSGGLTGSAKLTLGNGGATTAVVQLGLTGVTQVVNGFDVPPVFNAGTGGVILIYAPELTGRTTGNEMPPSRTLTTLNILNPNDITVAGGDVTVNGAGAGALSLGTARLITGANVVYFNSAAGTVTRVTGYVLGNFRKSYAAVGTKTFEVGTVNGYSPVDVNATAGTFPSDVTVTPVQAKAPNIAPQGGAIDRHWNVTAPGVTADLTFTYLDPTDLPVTLTEANLVLYRLDGMTYTNLGGTLNAAANNILGAAIGTFGLFTLAEPGAVFLQISDLGITKTDGVASSVAGSTTTYTIVASNPVGPDPANGVTVADTFPAECVAPTWTCVGAAGGTCTAAGAGNINDLVDLPIGASVTYTAQCPISAAAVGNLVNTATVATGMGGSDPTPANNSATDTNTLSSSADVSITKTDAQTEDTAGTSISYTIVASNVGPSDASNVTVLDSFPATLTGVTWTCVGAAGGTCAAAGAGNIGDVAALPVGGSVTYTVSATIAPDALGTLSNTASATVGGGATDPDPANNSATDTTNVVASADLAITLSNAPDPVIAGNNLTYTATVTNAGPSTATAVTITLPLPTNTTFVSGSVSGGGTCSPVVVCTVPTSLAPGASSVATIVLRVSPAALQGSTVNASATVNASSPDPTMGNNTANAVATVNANADLQLALTTSATVIAVNVPVTFTATSLNNGPSDAQGVSITINLTPDFRFTSLVATGATCTTPQVGNSGAIVCTWAGATAPGVTRTLQVVAFSNNQGISAVNASTTSSTTDPVANNNANAVAVQVGLLIQGIPTLGAYGLMLLGLMLGLMGFVAVRRQQ